MKLTSLFQAFGVAIVCVASVVGCGDRLTLVGDGAFLSLVSDGTLIDQDDLELLRSRNGFTLDRINLGGDLSAESLAAAFVAAGDGWIAIPAALKPYLPDRLGSQPARRVAVLYDSGDPVPGSLSVRVTRDGAYREVGRRAFGFMSQFGDPLRLSLILKEQDRELGELLVDAYLEAGGSAGSVQRRYIGDESPREQIRSAIRDLAGSETGVLVLSVGGLTGYGMELIIREGNPVILESPPVTDAYRDQILGYIHAPLVDLLAALPGGAGDGRSVVEVDSVYVEGTPVF